MPNPQAYGVLPTDHALHETLEIAQGFTPWFEMGFYIFSSARCGNGWQWVGDHIRPRVRVPEEWHWDTDHLLMKLILGRSFRSLNMRKSNPGHP